MTLALVAAGFILSTAITWAILSVSRGVIRWRRRRREMTVDPGLSGIPRLLDGESRPRRHTWPWAVLSMLGGAASGSVAIPPYRAPQGFHWADSELVLVRDDGGRFILDCLVVADLGEPLHAVGVPMTLRGRAAGSPPEQIRATLFAWADEGAPVDIAVGADRGVAVVTLSSEALAVALEIEEVARPR